MFLGLCIKNNNNYHYCRPFFINKDDNIFIGQIIRDVDFSIIVKLNEIIDLSIIVYPNKKSYHIANKNKLNPEKFKILGKYILFIDTISDIVILNNFNKGVIKKRLDNNHNVDIEFSMILMENKEYYILSTPYIKGNKSYLDY
jgi:hypothetical protein